MKITVLGGGGFIGSAIVDRLLQDRHELRVFERPRVEPYRRFGSDERVEWLTGDLMNVHDVPTALDGADVVVHLVSTTTPGNSNVDMAYDVTTNLVPSLQLLEAVVARGVRKIVFISSGGTVYGCPTYLPIDEKHPTEPRVSYGISKLAIEKYLLLYQHLHGIKVNILRVANPYGERQRVATGQGAIAAFLTRAIEGQPLEIWGDGSATRDYLYVGDVAEAFACAVSYEGSKSVFNVSSGLGTSLNDLILQIETILGRDVTRRYLPARPFDVPVSILANSLAREEMGWQPRVSLGDGLTRTAAWVRANLAQ